MIDWSPLLISLKTASLTHDLRVFPGSSRGTLGGELVKSEGLKMGPRTVFLTLPLVLPPTVAGFFLLWTFG